MLNSEQIRDFFRTMADGLVINAPAQNDKPSAESREQNQKPQRVSRVIAFAVGMPPMANC